MAKQVKTRRAAPAAKARIDARDLWLAGLGAVSLTRKNGIKLYGTLLEEGKQFQGRAEQQFDALQRQAREGLEQAKARVEAVVSPIRERAEATYGSVKSEVETRLQPVLAKLGVKPAPKARTRKAPVAKRKPAAKRRAKAA
jgi:poly(hydroxyalkanoate) granule-associated protein